MSAESKPMRALGIILIINSVVVLVLAGLSIVQALDPDTEVSNTLLIVLLLLNVVLLSVLMIYIKKKRQHSEQDSE